MDARTVIAIGSDNEMEVVSYRNPSVRKPYHSCQCTFENRARHAEQLQPCPRNNTNNVKLRTVTADINELQPRLNENDYDMVILGLNGAGDPRSRSLPRHHGSLRPQGVLLITDVWRAAALQTAALSILQTAATIQSVCGILLPDSPKRKITPQSCLSVPGYSSAQGNKIKMQSAQA